MFISPEIMSGREWKSMFSDDESKWSLTIRLLTSGLGIAVVDVFVQRSCINPATTWWFLRIRNHFVHINVPLQGRASQVYPSDSLWADWKLSCRELADIAFKNNTILRANERKGFISKGLLPFICNGRNRSGFFLLEELHILEWGSPWS